MIIGEHFIIPGLHPNFYARDQNVLMEREMIIEHLRKKRKIVILTFALLIFAFFENYYLNCYKALSATTCHLGYIYLILAAIVLAVLLYYRK